MSYNFFCFGNQAALKKLKEKCQDWPHGKRNVLNRQKGKERKGGKDKNELVFYHSDKF